MHQGAGLAPRQRLLQPGDGADLALTQALAQVLFGQRGHLPGKPRAQGVRLHQPGGQGLGLEEVEDLAGSRGRVGAVGEADDLARGLEQEAQGGVTLAPLEPGGSVALGLGLGGGQVFAGAVSLGFDHAHRVTGNEQHVIRRPGIGGVLAHRDAQTRRQVELLQILHDPTGFLQPTVDLDSGHRLRSHRFFYARRFLLMFDEYFSGDRRMPSPLLQKILSHRPYGAT